MTVATPPDPIRCVNCNKPIEFDDESLGWYHTETDLSECEECTLGCTCIMCIPGA